MDSDKIKSILDQGKKDISVESLKVSSDPENCTPEERKKRVKSLAGAISHALRQHGDISVRSFGKDTVYKAAKALAIARHFLSGTNSDIELSYSPAFIEADTSDGKKMSGICFYTFTGPKSKGVTIDAQYLENVTSKLMVKSDEDGISSEERSERLKRLAGAIAHAVKNNKECVVRAFGKASVTKAAKALAIARGYVAVQGPDLYCFNDFIMASMNGGEKTGIIFYCFTNQ